MLDLNAEGMKSLGFTIPEGSTGLMSGNYHEKSSQSETVVNFTVEKTLLLTFKYLVSSQSYWDRAIFSLDGKEYDGWISGIKQIEVKELLSAGEHTLKLVYTKNSITDAKADRAFIYDLKTTTSFHVAEYNATNKTLTFKKAIDANIKANSVLVEKYNRVYNIYKALRKPTITNIVFEESFKTYAPTSLREFFKSCIDLETISGLEYLNTANVKDMGQMFNSCTKLKSLDLTNFNTENVEDMTYMFCDCYELKSLDLTNFNTKNVKDMSCMFYDCAGLTSLDITSFNTENVKDMNNMFYYCENLKSLDLTNFNTKNVKNMERMFTNCSALTTIYASDKFVTTNVNVSDMMFKYCEKLRDYADSKTDHKYANCGSNGYFTSGGCGYAEFDDATGTLTFRYKAVKPKGAYDLNVQAFTPQWNKLGTNVKKVVFNASFANARPTICYAWFYNNTNLTTIEGIEYLNTEDVTNMEYMFAGCSALKSLNLSGFNTAKVTDMNRLFAGCSALESLDLSMFNTGNVTSMPNMFNGAKKLKTLNVSSFNTEKVKNMGHMFTDCSDLTSLDLSSFNTKGVEYVDYMFKNCSNLTTIYVSANFAFGSELKNGSKMFLDCIKLKGFKGYATNYTSNKLAKYTTGYLTKLVGKNGDEKIGAVGKTLTAESLALTDNKDFVAYEPFIATTATYNRTMKEGTTWATLCLPFEVSLENQNFRAFKLLSADETNNTVELEEVKTKIEAGTPVIIKMNEGGNTLKFSVADKKIENNVNTAVATEGSYQLQGIYTQKMFDKEADNNCYIVKGDKLMNPAKLLENENTKAVGSEPFRAYMVDKSTTVPAVGAKMFSIGFDNNGTTAIDRLNIVADDNAIYYDLQGKRLNGPQKGINIVKRGNKTMKVIIK